MAGPEADGARVVGQVIPEGAGGIKQAVEEGRGWTQEQVLAYAKTIPDNHPFFAESLEEMDEADLEAIRQIKEDGKDMFQMAEQAKNHGNLLFRHGKKNPAQYKHAITSYTEAEGFALKADRGPEVDSLLSQVYGNRCFAHLMLKNYGACKEDADRALSRNPTNVKALYRKARACQALKQYEDALSLCNRGLEIESDNKELKEIRAKAEEALDQARKKEERIAEEKRQRRQELHDSLTRVWGWCKERQIKLGPAFYAGAEHDVQVQALPSLDEETGRLLWPVLFLYPEYSTTDFVSCFGEDDMLALHLANMFPEEGPPAAGWDREGRYRCSNLEVYFQANSTMAFKDRDGYIKSVEHFRALIGLGEEMGLSREGAEAELEERNIWKDNGEYWVKVHVGCTLQDILSHSDHVVPATLPLLHVVAKGSSFHRDFLQRAGRKIQELLPQTARAAKR